MSTLRHRVKLVLVLTWLAMWLPAPIAEAAYKLEYVEDRRDAYRQRIVAPPPRMVDLSTGLKAVRAGRVTWLHQQRTKRAVSHPQVSNTGVWDRLAQCESGGNWSTNTGNGYFGGLQFLPSTWRAAGGTKYAPLPHLATREQQIAVAQSWLAKTSWSQWPACSRQLGLR